MPCQLKRWKSADASVDIATGVCVFVCMDLYEVSDKMQADKIQ
jgi:ferredoxin